MRRAKGLCRIVRGVEAARGRSLGDTGSGASSRRFGIALCAAACALGLLVFVAPADAALPTHPALPALNLSGFERVCGLAVDSAGNRYISDSPNHEIKIYSPTGTQLTSFESSANETRPCSLAVDSQGNVYVNGNGTDVVKYKPFSFPPTAGTTYEPDTSVISGTGAIVSEAEAHGVAVDSATDDVYIPLEGHISSYRPNGELISSSIGDSAVMGEFVSFGSVAVSGSTGKIYATSLAEPAKAYVLSPDGSQVLAETEGATTQAGGFTPFDSHSVAVDQSTGHFYLADVGHEVVDEFDAAAELVSEIPTPSGLADDKPSAVAVDNSGGENAGDVFVSAGQEPSSVLAFGPLTYAEFFTLELAKVGAGQGRVTSAPAGIDCGASCKVEFAEGTEVTLTATADPGSRFAGWQGCGNVTGDECTVTISGARKVTAAFTAKPAIESESVIPRDTSATLLAKVNPNGEETSYQFQFISETDYQENGERLFGIHEPIAIPVSPASIGDGEAGVAVSAAVSGLTPHTPYRFRVVASNVAGEGRGVTTAFTTYLPPDVFESCPNDAFRIGKPSAALPDCRAYEQASPVNKNGGGVIGTAWSAKASVNGDRVTFNAPVPIPGGEGGQNFTPPFMASRGSAGWTTQGLLPPQSAGNSAHQMGWSPDLSQVFAIATKLGERPWPGALFDRSTATPSAVTQITPYIDDLEGSVVFAGSSEDGSVAFFEVDPQGPSLRAGAAKGKPNLYVWDRETGAVRLAGALNDGKAPSHGVFASAYDWTHSNTGLGGAYARDEHAIAPDGSSIYFTEAGTGQLYRRLNPTEPQSEVVVDGDGDEECTQPQLACTIHVSASQKDHGTGENGTDPAGPHPAAFLGATSDGSQAFFMSSEMLTNEANTGPEQPPAQVGRATLNGEGPATEEDESFLFTHALGLAVDPQGKYVYWTDPSKQTIGRAKLDGEGNLVPGSVEAEFIVPGEGECPEVVKEAEIITGEVEVPPVFEEMPIPSKPRYVAVDEEHVYWTNSGREVNEGPLYGGGSIGRATLTPDHSGIEGEAEPTFVCGVQPNRHNPNTYAEKVVSNPQGIAVNSESIFWSNSTAFPAGGPRGIGRAALNGNSVETFQSIGVGGAVPRGIALDENFVYLGVEEGGGGNYIEGFSLSSPSNERHFLSTGSHGVRSLAIGAGYLYWASPGDRTISREKLAGFQRDCEAPDCTPGFVTLPGVPDGLAVYGPHLFWSTNGEAPSNPGNDLYRYDAASGQLTDLAPDPNGNGAEVLGMLGASEDGSYVYFAANGVLAEGAEQGDCTYPEGSGRCNLYLEHEGQISFIAPLAPDGNQHGSDGDNWRGTPGTSGGGGGAARTARVSADGRTLLFRSHQELTDYDNEGVAELYLFRVDASEPIVCVSCSPAGLPESGSDLGEIDYPGGNGSAADPTPVLSRNLSADGKRVFFETTAALVGADTNGDATAEQLANGEEGCPPERVEHAPSCQDVYEWEAPDPGNPNDSCHSEAQNGGCLYLISSGKSAQPAFFLDASASGDDVFFFTHDRLVAQDADNNVDVYDARVVGGIASQGEARAVLCEGEACRKGARPAPELSTPTTSLFSGPGNPASRHKQARKHRKKRHHHTRKHRRHANSNGRASR
jgi:hypothetical protein